MSETIFLLNGNGDALMITCDGSDRFRTDVYRKGKSTGFYYDSFTETCGSITFWIRHGGEYTVDYKRFTDYLDDWRKKLDV